MKSKSSNIWISKHITESLFTNRTCPCSYLVNTKYAVFHRKVYTATLCAFLWRAEDSMLFQIKTAHSAQVVQSRLRSSNLGQMIFSAKEYRVVYTWKNEDCSTDWLVFFTFEPIDSLGFVTHVQDLTNQTGNFCRFTWKRKNCMDSWWKFIDVKVFNNRSKFCAGEKSFTQAILLNMGYRMTAV